MSILVTGGLGYIGSHIIYDLVKQNYNVVIIDNLLNSNIDKLSKIKSNLTLNEMSNFNINFYKIDMLDYIELENIFNLHNIVGIIHLAGLKSVSESIKDPELYYRNNIVSTLNLVKCMKKFSVKNLIFSSSATVYGNVQECPYKESDLVGIGITNPYGKTKYFQEEMLIDLSKSENMNIIILRYFNPIGHLNLDFKEEPNGIPNNLFPYVVKVHNGELKKLTVFGSDYETKDGTCVRDFIHVMDLSDSHIVCLKHLLEQNETSGVLKIYNVGTGNGISVLELIKKYEEVNGVKINYVMGDRREGDVIEVYADVSKIFKEIGWKSKFTLEQMVKYI
jgi:UDP-glucose 4-epimerase